MDSALEVDISKAETIDQSTTNLRVTVEFRNLTFSVSTRDGGTFEILRQLTGICHSGRLQALMGPSGAGKTTLLDILAGNVYGGRVDGVILVNDTEVPVKSLAKLSCYVMQHPILLSSATVRESLMTSALLRLSKSITRRDKEQLVNDIIDELGLQDCANVLVGSEKDDIKGISGGQIRRLAVGVELVTRPRVIVLDEPTSGLDSEIALTIMNTLKTLTQNSRTVVCSIHQPNSDIVDTFDDFHLIANGRSVFIGPWSDAVPFFERSGYKCPMYKNPTDYFMTVLKDKKAAQEIADLFSQEQQSSTIENGKSSKVSDYDVLKSTTDGHSDVQWWFQTYILWIRFLKTWIRNPILFWSEMTQYAFTGIFIGLMYFDISNDLNFGTHDRYASQFFAMAAVMFTPAFSAVTLWDAERKLLKVETNRKSYSLFSYYLAKTGTTWPMELLLTLTLSVIIYYMIGYQNDAGKFFVFFIVLALFQLISETLGLISAFITSKSQYAIIVLSLGLLVVISFTGFIVRDIPVYFEWIKDIAYINFATAALVKSELRGITFNHPNGTAIPGSTLLSSERFDNDSLLEAQREDLQVLSNSLSVAENIYVMVGMLLGLRLLAFVALVMAARYRFL
eukprot:g3580.t1